MFNTSREGLANFFYLESKRSIWVQNLEMIFRNEI